MARDPIGDPHLDRLRRERYPDLTDDQWRVRVVRWTWLPPPNFVINSEQGTVQWSPHYNRKRKRQLIAANKAELKAGENVTTNWMLREYGLDEYDPWGEIAVLEYVLNSVGPPPSWREVTRDWREIPPFEIPDPFDFE